MVKHDITPNTQLLPFCPVSPQLGFTLHVLQTSPGLEMAAALEKTLTNAEIISK